MSEYGDTFLVAPFREFYKELTRLKRMVEAGAWVAPSEAGADDAHVSKGTWFFFPDVIAEPGGDPAANAEEDTRLMIPWEATRARGDGGEAAPAAGRQLAPFDHGRMSTFVWQRLLSLFERQEANAGRYGGAYGAEFYKEAQYVMVALADEVFLNIEWEGRRDWVSNLLEVRLFQTQKAGELIFQRIDHLLRERDPVYRDLCAVYLMALSLDFRGKYRGRRGGAAQLLGYRRRLYSFVFRRELDLDNEERRLFPETYYHTMREEAPRRMPNPRVWVVLLCATVAAYLAITHGIWLNLTTELNEANRRISNAVAEMEKKH